MYYIGLDVHKRTISYCVKDAAGHVYQEGKIGATRRDLDNWSSRVMALSGLRMMPLSPSPSLKFRTARFPRYGFKADISDGAFPSSALLKLAPSIRSPMFGLLPSFAPLESQTLLPVLSRAGFPLRDTVTRASRPYPRGPRSGQGYSVPVHQHLLTSSDPLTSTPRFPSYAGYTKSLMLCGSA